MTVNDRELMELRMAALFTHDAAGRIVTINELDGERAPRLFLGRTRDGHVWRVRDDLPQDVVDRLAALLGAQPPLDSANPRQPLAFAALCETLARHAPLGDVEQGPAWRFPETIPAARDVVFIGPENRELLCKHYAYAADHLDAGWPVAAVIKEGVAVSICHSSRLTPDVAEAGVDTEEPFRGRGYARDVAAAWAAAVRQSGRIPLYSTSWDNLASQAVARKLGLGLYGVDLSIR
jgi:RimJ/RimL family protein N-acetyltransferase